MCALEEGGGDILSRQGKLTFNNFTSMYTTSRIYPPLKMGIRKKKQIRIFVEKVKQLTFY
jgi:hypothetical protein